MSSKVTQSDHSFLSHFRYDFAHETHRKGGSHDETISCHQLLRELSSSLISSESSSFLLGSTMMNCLDFYFDSEESLFEFVAAVEAQPYATTHLDIDIFNCDDGGAAATISTISSCIGNESGDFFVTNTLDEDMAMWSLTKLIRDRFPQLPYYPC